MAIDRPKIVLKGSVKTYDFWTNFPEEGYKIVEDNPGDLHYWWFRTSLDNFHLTLLMTEVERARFMWQLYRHYRG